jgi:hypothetical protein
MIPKLAFRWSRTVAVVAASVVCLLSGEARPTSSSSSERSQAQEHLPRLILWAWERPEDLRGISEAGAAVLADTIRIAGEGVTILTRHQRVLLPADMPSIPVVRIETRRGFRPERSDAARRYIVGAIAHRVRALGAQMVQIDFDATASQRVFYAELLRDLRRALGDRTAISITALASWCAYDPWFAALPIDEAVPMLFRMGADEAAMRDRLRRGVEFASPLCRGIAGVATDEPWPPLRRLRRLYVFSPRPWTRAAVEAVRAAGFP